MGPRGRRPFLLPPLAPRPFALGFFALRRLALGRLPLRRLAVLVPALLLLALFHSRAGAEPREIPATVVRVAEGRAWVSADSGAIALRARLVFRDGRRTLATGEVTALLDGAIASVRLDSGSLLAVKKPDRLRVALEPPAVERLATLRAGIPASGRGSLAACPACSLRAPAGYRVERAAPAWWRLVREAAGEAPAPETLLVRFFGDATDEEIAWERGDVDVAVFWPAEPTASLRARLPAGALLAGARRSAAPDSSAAVGGAPPAGPCPLLANAAGRAAIATLGAEAFAELPACTASPPR